MQHALTADELLANGADRGETDGASCVRGPPFVLVFCDPRGVVVLCIGNDYIPSKYNYNYSDQCNAYGYTTGIVWNIVLNIVSIDALPHAGSEVWRR